MHGDKRRPCLAKPGSVKGLVLLAVMEGVDELIGAADVKGVRGLGLDDEHLLLDRVDGAKRVDACDAVEANGGESRGRKAGHGVVRGIEKRRVGKGQLRLHDAEAADGLEERVLKVVHPGGDAVPAGSMGIEEELDAGTGGVDDDGDFEEGDAADAGANVGDERLEFAVRGGNGLEDAAVSAELAERLDTVEHDLDGNGRGMG